MWTTIPGIDCGTAVSYESDMSRCFAYPRGILRFRRPIPHMTDHRSAAAQAYRHLYKTSAWRNGRLAFLAQNPLCTRCKANGRTTAATVVNHIKPHKGDLALFFSWENWEPVCKPHHDGLIQSDEKTGYLKGSDAQGRPRDPQHPWNRGGG